MCQLSVVNCNSWGMGCCVLLPINNVLMGSGFSAHIYAFYTFPEVTQTLTFQLSEITLKPMVIWKGKPLKFKIELIFPPCLMLYPD